MVVTKAWVPENLDIDALLDQHDRAIVDRVLWLGHTVRMRLAIDPRYRDSGMAPLHSTILRRVHGPRRLGPVRDLAESIGYVERNRSYAVGSFSQSYGIGREYAHARLRQHTIQDPSLLESIERERQRAQDSQSQKLAESAMPPETFDYLRRHLDRLRIDASARLLTPTDQIVADRIRRRCSWATVCDYGRLHTALTSTPRRLRANLHVDGRRLVGVDIGESQPLFIALGLATEHPTTTADHPHHSNTPEATPLMLCAKMFGESQVGGFYFPERGGPTMLRAGNGLNPGDQEGFVKPGTSGQVEWSGSMGEVNARFLQMEVPTTAVGKLTDIAAWLRLCEKRGLYQAVADAMGCTRADTKNLVMAALFGEPHHITRASRALEDLFPNAWAAIVAYKRKYGHAALAHAGQRAESAFIYGRCVRRLRGEHPDLWVATIHDSIITTEGSEHVVEAVMRSEFDRMGLAPTLAVEPFGAETELVPFSRDRLGFGRQNTTDNRQGMVVPV